MTHSWCSPLRERGSLISAGVNAQLARGCRPRTAGEERSRRGAGFRARRRCREAMLALGNLRRRSVSQLSHELQNTAGLLRRRAPHPAWDDLHPHLQVGSGEREDGTVRTTDADAMPELVARPRQQPPSRGTLWIRQVLRPRILWLCCPCTIKSRVPGRSRAQCGSPSRGGAGQIHAASATAATEQRLADARIRNGGARSRRAQAIGDGRSGDSAHAVQSQLAKRRALRAAASSATAPTRRRLGVPACGAGHCLDP
jgi:hypothetical protein